MLTRYERMLASLYAAILASALAGGVAIAGTCGSCNDDVKQCFPLGEYIQEECCVNSSCMQCTREKYLCFEPKGETTKPGPPFNCHSPSGSCN